MARLSPEQAAEKWARRAAAASQDYTAGIQSVTQAPGAKAAQKAQKALSGYQDAISSGRWAAAVGRVSLSEWQTQAIQKGSARYSGGVTQAQGKMAAAMSRTLPMVDQAVQSISGMDDSTVEGRINRAAAFQRKMNELANSRR